MLAAERTTRSPDAERRLRLRRMSRLARRARARLDFDTCFEVLIRLRVVPMDERSSV